MFIAVIEEKTKIGKYQRCRACLETRTKKRLLCLVKELEESINIASFMRGEPLDYFAATMLVSMVCNGCCLEGVDNERATTFERYKVEHSQFYLDLNTKIP